MNVQSLSPGIAAPINESLNSEKYLISLSVPKYFRYSKAAVRLILPIIKLPQYCLSSPNYLGISIIDHQYIWYIQGYRSIAVKYYRSAK